MPLPEKAASDGADHSVRLAGCLLADALRGYFHLRRLLTDWLVVAESAMTAATLVADPRARAAAEHSLGTAYRCSGDLAGAARHYGAALRLSRLVDWPDAEATALANLGIVAHGQGRLAAAVDHLTRALAIDRRTGRRAGVANNLGNRAAVLLDQGRLDEAATDFNEALELNRRSGNRHGQALALTGLAQAHWDSGRPADAATVLTEAMRHCTEIGDQDGQAIVHLRQSELERDIGRIAVAIDHARAALALARDGGDPRTEADALTILGSIVPDQREATTHYTRAYTLARTATVPRTEIAALMGLADCARQRGDPDRAARYAADALRRARRSGYRQLEHHARAMLATVADVAGLPHLDGPALHVRWGGRRGPRVRVDRRHRAIQRHADVGEAGPLDEFEKLEELEDPDVVLRKVGHRYQSTTA